jgi:hypothetical protein
MRLGFAREHMMTTRRVLAVGVTVALCAVLSPRVQAGPPSSSPVPVPTVEGPVEGGIHGGPHGATYKDPGDFDPPYIEREYFISGTATSYAEATAGQTAEYKTRIYTLRPEDPRHFNGTVIVEWNNVTGTIDASPVWYLVHEYLIREGYAFVGVTAQRMGQEPSPLALKQHDPVRYGSLHHPGDDYSWDIFSQAGRAVVDGDPKPLGDLSIDKLVAVGQSQSGGRLGEYLSLGIHATAGVYDGVMPMTAGATDIPDDVGPVLWVNSESESQRGEQQPDSGDFILWEIAGAPHFTWWGFSMGVGAGDRNNRPLPQPDLIDRDSAAQYGERGGGPCPQQFMPDRYAYSVAIEQMDRWLRTPGRRPLTGLRIERDGAGAIARDELGNARGGYRLPPLDVPVATYIASCGLFGETRPLDPATLSSLYPTHEDYVAKMDSAVADAIAGGRLLPEDGEELLERARGSSVGNGPLLLAGI